MFVVIKEVQIVCHVLFQFPYLVVMLTTDSIADSDASAASSGGKWELN